MIATRRNNKDLQVANRDLYTVTAITADGGITVTPAGEPRRGRAAVDDTRTLPADYVAAHVELAYATTVHGVQGDTTAAGHLVVSEHTGAAACYVGMTRGRQANTAHLIAQDLGEAKAQWLAAARRSRPDTGVEAARVQAVGEAARYAGAASPPDQTQQERLATVLDQLRHAWSVKADAQAELSRLMPRIEQAQAGVQARQEFQGRIAPLAAAADKARAAAAQAAPASQRARQELDERTQQIHAELTAAWTQNRADAAQAAVTMAAGPGRLGAVTGRRRDYLDARRWLDRWATGWQPVLPDLPGLVDRPDRLADYTTRAAADGSVDQAIAGYAARTAATQLPDQAAAVAAGRAAEKTATDAAAALKQAGGGHLLTSMRSYAAPRNTAETLRRLTRQASDARSKVAAADTRLAALAADPAIIGLPDPAGWLAEAHNGWQHDQTKAAIARQTARQAADRTTAAHRPVVRYQPPSRGPDPGRGPGISM